MKQKDANIPALMTLQESADILKVHPNTLRAWDKKRFLLLSVLDEKD